MAPEGAQHSGDATDWGRRACMAVIRSPQDLQAELGEQFPKFVDRFRDLVAERPGHAFDATAVASGLRQMFNDFGLLAWLAANTEPVAQKTRGAVRTRGAVGTRGTARGDNLEGLLRQASQRLARR